MGIDEWKRAITEARDDLLDLRAVLFQSRAPPGEASARHLEADFYREPVPHARRGHVRPRKEREIGSRMSFGIRVEEMVGTRIVLVDAPLDEAHAKDARVEVEILLCRSRNRRDVV